MVATITKIHISQRRSSFVSRGSEVFFWPIWTILKKFCLIILQSLHATIVKLINGSFQQYGETLKEVNREIYHCLMNSNLNVSDDVKQSQNA